MIGLNGKRVFVTAGGAGIGACLVRRFAAAGARVAYSDIDPDTMQTSDNPNIFANQADVTDETAMQSVFERVESQLGGIDILCANAGTGGPAGRIEDLSLTDWRATLSANLDGAFLAAKWASPLMRHQKSGCILLTSSTAGLFGYPFRSPYATAKWGVIGLMKTLAMELGPDGIRVNALCPGSVEGTRMDRVVANESAARGVSEQVVRDSYVTGVSLKTWVSADDIADMALFLTSDAGSKISGQAMCIDGHTETLNA